MSISVNEFWNRLTGRAGVDAPRCRQWALDFAQSHRGQPPADLPSLVEHLVATDQLTSYQVECLLSPTAAPLRAGELFVQRPAEVPPLTRWLWVSRDLGQPAAALAFRLDGPASPPTLPDWLQAHAAVQGPSLQPIDPVFDGQQPRWVISRLPPGRSLAALVRPKKPLSRAELLRIGIALGDALTTLHRGGLVHGRLQLDRVWIGQDRSVWLLRDATGPPSGPLVPTAGWFDDFPTAAPAGPLIYAAPEFTIPGQLPTPWTDQYALGCLLYQLASGGPPFNASDPDAMLRCHVGQTLAPLRAAAQAGAAGDPLLRALAWAMAKNAQGRFADTAALTAALRAIADAATATRIPSAAASAGPAAAPSAASADAVTANTSARPVAAGAPAGPTPVPQPRPAGPTMPATPSSPTVRTAPAVPSAASAPAAAVGEVAGWTAAAAPRGAAAGPVAARGPGGRRRRRRSRRGPLVVGGLGFAVMILMVMVLVNRGRQREAGQDGTRSPAVANVPPGAAPPSPRPQPVPSGGTASGVDLVDDPNSLWAAPSSADPPELRMIPPGPQMVVVLRPRQMLQSAEGRRLLAALEPEIGDAWQRLEKRTGVPPVQIEQLTLALQGAGGGWPAASLGVQLSAPVALGVLRERWGAEAAQTSEGATVFAAQGDGGDAYYVAEPAPSDQTPVAAFAVGSLAQIRSVAELQGGAIPLPRQLQQLWRAAPADADLTLLTVPNFLFADGRQMLGRYAPQFADPLRRLLLPDTAGLMLTSSLRPQWYLEARLSPGAGTSAAALTRNLQQTVQQLPARAEQFLLTTIPDPSWRAVALRLPQMMRAAADYTRFGVSDGQAIANLYLPAVAAPNVALAGLLVANTPPGSAVGTAAGPDSTAVPLTPDQMLSRPMSVRFDQQSLEFALAEIMDEFNSRLAPQDAPLASGIIGGDLEKEGITQNQQIRDFDQQQQPLRAVLTELVRRANPVTTVQSASDADQKLVWVLAADPQDPDQPAILITTRVAAQARYQLPEEFTAP